MLITLLSLAGAISFSWYYLGYYRHASSLLREPQFRALLVVCAVTVIVLFGFMMLANPERVVDNLADAALTVITSYSIHYTKLYEKAINLNHDRKKICAVRGNPLPLIH